MASKLEELASCHPDSSAWLQADQRLILAREAHYPEKIHYSGGLRWTRGTKLTRLLAGYTACTQVRKANDWKMSENLLEVTCLRCLHLIKLAENSS